MDHIIEKNKNRTRKGRVYFTKETEAAIVKYNSLDLKKMLMKEVIYIKTIYIGLFIN